MALEAFVTGCNIVGIKKFDKNFGMCCAWAQMIDYDRITLLLGAQSVTGQILRVGDLVGVSALAAGQKAIALKLGEGHSGKADKFAGIPIRVSDTAILVEGAKVTMKCQVLDILRLPGMETDALLVLRVLRSEQNPNLKFLLASDL